jgi:hypothetical protein
MLRDMYEGENVVKRLMRLWGRIFESYHDWIWEQQYQRDGKCLKGPCYTDGNDESPMPFFWKTMHSCFLSARQALSPPKRNTVLMEGC